MNSSAHQLSYINPDRLRRNNTFPCQSHCHRFDVVLHVWFGQIKRRGTLHPLLGIRLLTKYLQMLDSSDEQKVGMAGLPGN